MLCNEKYFYYKVAFAGLNLKPLTYKSKFKIEPFFAVLVTLNSKNITGYVLSQCEKPEFETIEILQILQTGLNKFQIELFKFINYYYTSDFGATLSLFEPLNLNKTLKFKFKKADKMPKIFKFLRYKKRPILNQTQENAFKFINSHQTSLLFGDTGSGKSEVYISAIRDALNDNKQVLFLMPEIALTPQMQTRLKHYFGDSVAIWHSKVSPSKKCEILKGIESGTIRLIAGARSSLFLPLKSLSLIVVDEEHDDSYKNSISKPRYNAKDLAIFLGAKFNIKVILGSATPSLTTFYKFPSFRMRGTFFESQKSFIYDKSQVSLSPTIKNEIANSLSEKKQVVVFLPTRANFKYLICKECGSTLKCPFCSVGMSFYKKQNLLKCQYCGYTSPANQNCNECNHNMIEAKKMGTSELLELLSQEFANAKIAKFDRDEITTQKKLTKTLDEFNKGDIDILVGTQMLSKGHDYHNVDLAVIMGVDELLVYPDFRSQERTLALVKQVAGRSGRKGYGRVVIQSYESEFFEKYLQNYDEFLLDEYENRTSLYPPFKRLLRIIISHKNDSKAQQILGEIINKIQALKQQEYEFEIIGYGKCAIELLGSKFRYDVLLRSSSHRPLVKIANICSGDFVDIDIDPLSFS